MREFPREIKGERIELKTIEPTFANAQMIFEVIRKSREHLLLWVDWATTTQPEDTFVFLQGSKEGREKKTKYDFGIFKDGKYIGNAGIFDVSEKNHTAEIGYWLAQEHTGQGYASETVKLLETEGFKTLNLNRIVIECDARNVKSANVARRNNYTQEGTHREDRYIESGQRWRSTILFAKLKSEV